MTLLSLYVLWLLYLANMNLERAKKAGTIRPFALYAGYYPTLVVGGLLDIAVNVVIGSIVFLERPQELLLTKRLSRLIKTDGWRSKLALWVCKTLLDPFDPEGRHCG